MKNILYITLLCFVFTGCQLSGNKQQTTEEHSEQENIQESTEEVTEPISYNNEPVDILLPFSYRVWDGYDQTTALNSNWVELYEENGSYYIGKASYTVETGFDDCAGTDTRIINPDKNVLLYINYPELEEGEITFTSIPQKRIWPGERVEFMFNDQTYYLEGEGKILNTAQTYVDDSEDLMPWHDVENYTLYIGNHAVKEAVFFEPGFNDTFMSIVFIGDIDRDGKPDFVFEVPRDYEESRSILFLSSKASDGNLLYKFGEISIQFDC